MRYHLKCMKNNGFLEFIGLTEYTMYACADRIHYVNLPFSSFLPSPFPPLPFFFFPSLFLFPLLPCPFPLCPSPLPPPPLSVCPASFHHSFVMQAWPLKVTKVISYGSPSSSVKTYLLPRSDIIFG